MRHGCVTSKRQPQNPGKKLGTWSHSHLGENIKVETLGLMEQPIFGSISFNPQATYINI